jgi:hypothetical protein
MSFKDKFNLGLTLLIICAVGLTFFYINAIAILELLHINPQILIITLKKSFSIILVSTGLWLVFPIKLRIFIEAFIHSYGKAKNKLLTITDSNKYPEVFATKLAPTLLIRLIGIVLVASGLTIWMY